MVEVVLKPGGKQASVNLDGSLQLENEPLPLIGNRFHAPSPFVPEQQWSPETGITRYEWARQMTPEHQVPFFERLRRLYRKRPPRLLTAEENKILRDSTCTLPTGLQGYGQEAIKLYDSWGVEINELTPDGLWRVGIMASRWVEGTILDKIIVSHRDYRTLADWEFLVRLRSWVWEDDRDAFIWMPGMDTSREGWENRYENARPNAMQIVSPRPEE